ncbi:MAG: sensor histidine kinase [Rhizobiales bacterium]|nr:sensor histidine kinase [Hyphomicrobiales bacterium]
MTLIVGLNAALTYSTVQKAVALAPDASATALRQALRATFWGAARVGVTAGRMASMREPGECAAVLEQTLAVNSGYLAIRIDADGRRCAAVRAADAARTEPIAAAFDRPATGEPTVGVDGAIRMWVTTVREGAMHAPLIEARFGPPGSEGRVWIMLGEDLLEAVVVSADSATTASLGLVDASGAPMLERRVEGEGWLPASGLVAIADEPARVLRGRDGAERSYAVKPLFGPSAYVVAGLDSHSTRMVLWQLALSIVVPIATLLALLVLYSRTMKSSVVDWVDSLDSVARQSTFDPGVRAPVSARMPAELQNVARSFNDMLSKREARENALSGALVHNQYLARELHHRVKNSLQIVQSLLAQGAREGSPETRAAMAAAQVRAYVLSAAYRRALADGEMRPVELDPLLEDVAGFAGGRFARPGQSAQWTFHTRSRVAIDDAIPLGMIVVELLARALPAAQATRVSVAMEVDAAGWRLSAGTDGTFGAVDDLLKAFARQAAATMSISPDGRALSAAAPLRVAGDPPDVQV